MEESKGDHIAQRLAAIVKRAKSLRTEWNERFDEVIDYVLPLRTYTARGEDDPSDTAGDEMPEKLFSSHAINAAEDSASMIYGTLINPAVKYLQFASLDEKLNKNPKHKKILDERTQGVLNAFNSPRSGFPVASYEALLNLVTIGTAGFLTEDHDEGLKYSIIPISNLYLLNEGDTSKSEVRTVVIVMKMTARRIAERWPDVELPEPVRKCLEDKDGRNADKMFEVANIIEPLRKNDPLPLNPDHKVGSYFLLCKGNVLLESGGFNEMPISTPRASVIAGQVYGRSPAMRSMPDIIALQKFRQIELLAMQLAAIPPVKVEAGATEEMVRIAPGAQVSVRRGRMGGIEPMHSIANPAVAVESSRLLEEAIDRAFFLDAFMMPDFDRATTLEVQAHLQQKQQMLGPLINRIFTEFLVPVVERTAAILERKGLIPKLTDELKASKVRVDFIGQLALSQRAGEVASMQQWLTLNTPVMQTDPESMLSFDADFFMRQSSYFLNTPTGILRPREDVEKMISEKRERDSMMQETESMSKGIKEAGQGAKAFSEAMGMTGGGG